MARELENGAIRFTILVDMDCVLENLNEVWIEELNRRHGTTVKPDEVTEWDMTKFYPGLTRTKVFAPLHDENTWNRVTPLPQSQYAVDALKADGHDVIVVTAAHPDTVRWKYEWLSRYFPSIPFKDIIFTSRKQLVHGDYLIDDAPHNLFGGDYRPILFEAPHNRTWEPEDSKDVHLWRVPDWPAVLKLMHLFTGKAVW